MLFYLVVIQVGLDLLELVFLLSTAVVLGETSICDLAAIGMPDIDLNKVTDLSFQ